MTTRTLLALCLMCLSTGCFEMPAPSVAPLEDDPAGDIGGTRDWAYAPYDGCLTVTQTTVGFSHGPPNKAYDLDNGCEPPGFPLLCPFASCRIERPCRASPDFGENECLVDTETGRWLLIAHLQSGSMPYADGEVVAAGTRIGNMGNTGRVSGSPNCDNGAGTHLHIEAGEPGTVVGGTSTDPFPGARVGDSICGAASSVASAPRCGNGKLAIDAPPPTDGAPFMAPGSPDVYLGAPGMRAHIADEACWDLLFPNSAEIACHTTEQVDGLAEGPAICRDGSFVKEAGDSTVFELIGGRTRPLCGPWSEGAFVAAFGAGFELVVTVPPWFFDRYPVEVGGIYPAGASAPTCAALGCGTWVDPEQHCYAALDCPCGGPPVEEPPVDDPPIDDAPVEEPPAEEPPAVEPPADEPIDDLCDGTIDAFGCQPFELTLPPGTNATLVWFWNATSHAPVATLPVSPNGGTFRSPAGACAASLEYPNRWTSYLAGTFPAGAPLGGSSRLCTLGGATRDLCVLPAGEAAFGIAHDGACLLPGEAFDLNGHFDDTSDQLMAWEGGWGTYSYEWATAAATCAYDTTLGTPTTPAVACTHTGSVSSPWHTQFGHDLIPIEYGDSYRASWCLRGSTPGQRVHVVVQETHGPQQLGLHEIVALVPNAWNCGSTTFTAAATCSDSKLTFWLGEATAGTLLIDAVELWHQP